MDKENAGSSRDYVPKRRNVGKKRLHTESDDDGPEIDKFCLIAKESNEKQAKRSDTKYVIVPPTKHFYNSYPPLSKPEDVDFLSPTYNWSLFENDNMVIRLRRMQFSTNGEKYLYIVRMGYNKEKQTIPLRLSIPLKYLDCLIQMLQGLAEDCRLPHEKKAIENDPFKDFEPFNEVNID